MSNYEIYTDGSCRKNPGPGGYGVVIIKDGKEVVDYVTETAEYTTNNEMELSAIKYAVDFAKDNYIGNDIVIYTDSAYALNSITKWCEGWKRNNWLTSKGLPVANRVLIETIYNNYTENFLNCQVRMEKVKGHVGLIGNEMADALARNSISEFQKIISINNILVSCSEQKIANM